MKSLWNDAEAAAFCARYGGQHGDDVALRVYSSRLIGRDASLVLHGGGNTSVKTRRKNLFGEGVDVLCVKGSGSDLSSVEPAGLPAVELEPLRRLRSLSALSDEDMVREVRARLLDPDAPTPSVEALLHAFLPAKFVDHTHADAVLVLTDQPDGEALAREALGERVAILPWIFPGFPLARAVAEACERAPGCEGIVLQKHGLLTFGSDARTSYERTIALVDRAERFIGARLRQRRSMLLPTSTLVDQDSAAQLAARAMPIIRGSVALAHDGHPGEARRVLTRFVGQWRGDEDLRAFTAHADCRRLAALGPITPDHVIRTKGPYLVLTVEEAVDAKRCARAVLDYQVGYATYFQTNKHRLAGRPIMLDPLPRVVLVEGVGVFAFGVNAKAAAVAGDIAEHTLRAKADAEAIGRYEPLAPEHLFEMEYWSLEQAKFGKQKPPVLGGRVALISGGAGALGFGVAEAVLDAGAEVVLTDVDEDALARIHNKLVEKYGALRVAAVPMDVTDAAAVDHGFAAACRLFGGVDIVIPNAGVALVKHLQDMDPAAWRRVVDVNLTGTMTVLRAAARVFAAQGTGGTVVIQASKNVFDPGAGFGAYSASKAGAHQLGKIAALELAPIGVTVNMINADAVFGDDDVPSGLWREIGPDRMRARGLDPEGLKDFYRKRSLLQLEVRPDHVGAAVVFFAAHAPATTGATLPVDAGIPGAFPR
jgi:rhamnulose-1-phosphate aldolase/alcohol dehydrogenase